MRKPFKSEHLYELLITFLPHICCFSFIVMALCIFGPQLAQERQEAEANQKARQELENTRKTYVIYMDGIKYEPGCICISQYENVVYDDDQHIVYIRTTHD